MHKPTPIALWLVEWLLPASLRRRWELKHPPVDPEDYCARLRYKLAWQVPKGLRQKQIKRTQHHLEKKQEIIATGIAEDQAWRLVIEDFGDLQLIVKANRHPFVDLFLRREVFFLVGPLTATLYLSLMQLGLFRGPPLAFAIFMLGAILGCVVAYEGREENKSLWGPWLFYNAAVPFSFVAMGIFICSLSTVFSIWLVIWYYLADIHLHTVITSDVIGFHLSAYAGGFWGTLIGGTAIKSPFMTNILIGRLLQILIRPI